MTLKESKGTNKAGWVKVSKTPTWSYKLHLTPFPPKLLIMRRTRLHKIETKSRVFIIHKKINEITEKKTLQSNTDEIALLGYSESKLFHNSFIDYEQTTSNNFLKLFWRLCMMVGLGRSQTPGDAGGQGGLEPSDLRRWLRRWCRCRPRKGTYTTGNEKNNKNAKCIIW